VIGIGLWSEYTKEELTRIELWRYILKL